MTFHEWFEQSGLPLYIRQVCKVAWYAGNYYQGEVGNSELTPEGYVLVPVDQLHELSSLREWDDRRYLVKTMITASQEALKDDNN